MTISRRLKVVLAAAVVAVLGTELANSLTATDSFSLIPPAEARVGRPLTPVSVAGVARRTTRRCAAGVYNC
jgi:hypothetical protein